MTYDHDKAFRRGPLRNPQDLRNGRAGRELSDRLRLNLEGLRRLLRAQGGTAEYGTPGGKVLQQPVGDAARLLAALGRKLALDVGRRFVGFGGVSPVLRRDARKFRRRARDGARRPRPARHRAAPGVAGAPTVAREAHARGTTARRSPLFTRIEGTRIPAALGTNRPRAMTSPTHTFHAVAFVENLALRDLARAFPEAKRSAHELWYTTPAGGTVFVYPFGAMVFHDVPPAEREAQVARLRSARPGLTDARGSKNLSRCGKSRVRSPTSRTVCSSSTSLLSKVRAWWR